MIDGRDSGGRFASVQHLFAPRALAAPLHRHRDEDEDTVVLSGRIGAVLDGEEVVAGSGDLLFEPRGQWHTSSNATDNRPPITRSTNPSGQYT